MKDLNSRTSNCPTKNQLNLFDKKSSLCLYKIYIVGAVDSLAFIAYNPIYIYNIESVVDQAENLLLAFIDFAIKAIS